MSYTVIEWPQRGSAQRFPTGGWWVVDEREGQGFTPIAGPFRTREEANRELAELQP